MPSGSISVPRRRTGKSLFVEGFEEGVGLGSKSVSPKFRKKLNSSDSVRFLLNSSGLNSSAEFVRLNSSGLNSSAEFVRLNSSGLNSSAEFVRLNSSGLNSSGLNSSGLNSSENRLGY